jgi:hypothetical protein
VNFTDNAAPVAPTITTQPASQTVTAGQVATFSVTATGTAPLSYQWSKNGAVMSGATSSSYSTPATTSSDNGALFTVLVSNTAGSVTSNAATLTVTPATLVSIAVTPAIPSITKGATQQFTATGTFSDSSTQVLTNAVWTSATPGVATINVTGLATAVAAGTSAISATSGSISGSTLLTVNPAPAPAIQVSPINFGNDPVGTNLSLPLIIKNTGTATLSITQVTETGSAFFTVSGFSLPLNVPAGQQTTITVAFLPTLVGPASGNITIVSNAPTSPTSVGLSGAGIAATYLLGANPTSLGFGNVNVGNTGSLSATLTNNGNSNVTISSVSVTPTGTGFNASGITPGTILSPNQSATLSVVFTPLAAGSVTGTVAVLSNATNSPTTIGLSGTGGSVTTIVNVKNFGATGNGSTNDTAAINSAIAALTPGATLLFPCGTYLTTSQLTLSLSNITIDGSSCATIHNTNSGTIMVIGGSGNGNPNYGSSVALSATANELSTSFTTVSGLGVNPGDYVLLHQGGMDSSTGSGNTGCDPSGCRSELLKVASASGNTITVTTALHDTFNPSVNNATAQKMLGPLTGITMKNIVLDGNSSNVYGLAIAGVADSTVTGITVENVRGSALLNRGDFKMSWSNIAVTGAGSAHCGSSAWFEDQGNLSVNGMVISNENPGTSGAGCLDNGAFGFELIGSANSTIANLTVDGARAYGRPFKTTAARWNTFNSLTIRNGVAAMNGISVEYYSSHNTYNNCVVTNNGAGTGTGTGSAGINLFGNFNQYNSFNNCMIIGNGNVQFSDSGYDALHLAADSSNTINGGVFTGINNVTAVIELHGANDNVSSAVINGPGAQGLYLGSTGACVNNNTFSAGTGLGTAISSNSATNIGSGNTLNGLSSTLTQGGCTAPKQMANSR